MLCFVQFWMHELAETRIGVLVSCAAVVRASRGAESRFETRTDLRRAVNCQQLSVADAKYYYTTNLVRNTRVREVLGDSRTQNSMASVALWQSQRSARYRSWTMSSRRRLVEVYDAR